MSDRLWIQFIWCKQPCPYSLKRKHSLSLILIYHSVNEDSVGILYRAVQNYWLLISNLGDKNFIIKYWSLPTNTRGFVCDFFCVYRHVCIFIFSVSVSASVWFHVLHKKTMWFSLIGDGPLFGHLKLHNVNIIEYAFKIFVNYTVHEKSIF